MMKSPVVCPRKMNNIEKKAVYMEPLTQVFVMDALVFYVLGCMNAYVQKTMRQVMFITGIAGCHNIDCVLVISYNIYCYQD